MTTPGDTTLVSSSEASTSARVDDRLVGSAQAIRRNR